jgi:predicted nucleic acid-binding protein
VYISQKKLEFEKLLNNYDVFCTSVISYMEVFGYIFSNEDEKAIVDALFENIEIINLNQDIVKKVIEIRKHKKIKLPDAIVSATASINELDLITRNIDDFKNIDSTVKLFNPFD